MNPATPASLLVAGIYYVIVGILTFFSLFGVYVLIRYGKSTLLSISISLIYGLFYLVILAHSYNSLRSLSF